ncbi:MAG: glycosyltransferase [Leptolyngbyaceae cyanobacterium bins.349]|nr:glycosyltransferase [Leptolyngbyaceae cyanobacterium bins.349]
MYSSQQDQPLVSVLIPLHNTERFIALALTSVLQEQRIPLEVIVIDDHSTDGSLAAIAQIQDSRIRVINSAGKGISDTLNTGLAAARGDIIVRCDADDVYPADRLLHQVEWLQKNPEYGAICGSYAAVDPRGSMITPLSVMAAGEITEELRQGITRTHLATFAIRADVMQAIGGFRPYFVTAEDIDFQLRLGAACRVWYEPTNCYHYRIHGASITHTQKSNEREFFEAIAREFQQQRQLTGLDDLDRGCPPLPPQEDSPSFRATHHIQGFLLGQAWQMYQDGDKWQALTTGWRAALTAPGNVSVWQSLAAMVVKSVVAL